MAETNIEKIVLSANGFSSFNPMQKKIVSAKLFEKSLVVSSPTASGKTIIAELAILHSIFNEKKKVVYTCPLRALASEHFNDFKKKYSKEHFVRFALSTGDLDSSSAYLANFDCIFTTYEKLDSLVRHNAEWLQNIGLLIVDEIHEIDSGRGPTIEVTIAKMRQLNSLVNILALSATIPNAKEISEWLNAELVESDYRPVPLKEGVFFNEQIHYSSSTEDVKDGLPMNAIIEDTLVEKKKQALVFASTRKNAESFANTLSGLVNENLSQKEKEDLKIVSERILNILDVPTEQCRKLSFLVSKGVAFHHAGLMDKQRHLIEESFRENKIKVVSATPTLAAGVNLPSHTVIIPSLYRFEITGMERIPVREYKQMAGRCVSGDTFVYTNYGIKKVEEIFSSFFDSTEVGKKMVVGNLSLLGVDLETGRTRGFKVNSLWKRKVEELVEIETRSGKRIRVTGEHSLLSFTKINAGKPRIASFSQDKQIYENVIKLRAETGMGSISIASVLMVPEKERRISHWIYDNSKPFEDPYVWKQAKELTVGKSYIETDYLSCPVDFDISGTIKKPIDFVSQEKFVQKGNILVNKQGHQGHAFPEDWSENLCRFIAKIMSDGNIYYNKKDNSYLIRYYNKDQKVQEEYRSMIKQLFGKDCGFKWRRGTYYSGFKSLVVGNFLENLGIPSGKKSFLLKMPEIMFYLPREMVKSFIKEYSDCDGWETKESYVVITSSEQLARDFCLLFSKLGYIGRLYKKKPNSFRQSPIWESSVTKSQFHGETEKNKVGNICPDQIKSIKPLKNESYVFDFTLEEGHNFIANGLVVHNCGRPKFDSEGRAIVFARSDSEKDDILENYINGEIETVNSWLGQGPFLRMHLLSLTANGFVFDLKSMESFFSKTFYAKQFNGVYDLLEKLSKVLHELIEMEFIEGNENSFRATRIGKRVSELYLDPFTAFSIINGLNSKKKFSELFYLFLFVNSSEFSPWLSVSKKAEAELWESLAAKEGELPIDLNREQFYDFNLLRKFNSSLMLESWVNEKPEQLLLDEFNVQPGILYSKLKILDWLAYSSIEIAKMLSLEQHFSSLSKMRRRIASGIKEELIALCEVRGIGRVRARRLWRANIKGIADLKKADVKDLGKILGEKVAEKIKEAIGQ